MRTFVVAAILCVACEDGDPPTPDARQCPERPSAETYCYNTCGNGRLDRCWKTMNSYCGGAVYYTMETCESTSTCLELGLCGGSSSCDTDCIGPGTTGCTPCL